MEFDLSNGLECSQVSRVEGGCGKTAIFNSFVATVAFPVENELLFDPWPFVWVDVDVFDPEVKGVKVYVRVSKVKSRRTINIAKRQNNGTIKKWLGVVEELLCFLLRHVC